MLFFMFAFCSLSEESINFRNSEIYGKVDSLIYHKDVLNSKRFFFRVNYKWYSVPSKYYGSFFHYTNKYDSLAKESGRWDISVYREKNGKWTEKYYKGAQGHYK